jgi:hypothetical protein
LAAIRAAAEKRNRPGLATPGELVRTADNEEEAPEGNPPPATQQSLKLRRQQALEAAMAAKVRRAPEETAAPAEEAPAPAAKPAAAAEKSAAGEPAGTNMHGVSPGERAAREEAFNRDAAYGRLMSAKSEDVGGLVAGMSPEEAAAHLARLDSAPGDNPAARVALEARAGEQQVASEPEETSSAAVTAERESPREVPAAEPEEQTAPQTLAERRAARRFVNAQKGRTQFADTTEQARPEDQIYSRGPRGEHVVETPNDGRTVAVDHPNGHDLIVRSTETGRADRGAGNGTARLERLAQVAHDRGGVLRSDNRVSEQASRVYDRLRERGYDVRTNPHTVDPGTGERISTSELRPVHEVGQRDVTKLTGMQLKRLAASGDTTARAELDRRINAPAEPRYADQAPEAEGALAQKRPQLRDTGFTQDMRQRVRLTKPEAEEVLKPILDRVGNTGVTVHESRDADTVPQYIRDAMGPDTTHSQARGAYDPATDTVHLFANAHDDREHLQRTAVHEIVGLLGLRRLLGDNFGDTMDGIYKNLSAKGKAWAKDYADQHDLNLRDPVHQRVIADEYAAHLAEFTEENPGAWQKIVDAVRAGLRKIGLVREWNDNDIRGLIRKSETNLRTVNSRAKALQADKGLRFADVDDSEHFERYAPDHPLAMAAKLGKLTADQEDYSPGMIRSLHDWGATVEQQMGEYKPSTAASVKEAWDKTLDGRLSALFLHNLPDLLNVRTRPLMPSPQRFIDVHDAMEGVRGRVQERGAKIAKEWGQWNPKQADGGEGLYDLMHDSTLTRIDPSKAYKAMYDTDRVASNSEAADIENRRQRQYKRLKAQYDGLDPKGKEIFNTVRDEYTAQRDNELRGLEKRINALAADSSIKDKHIAALRRQFEQGKIEPYFGLQRYGDHWARAKDEFGNTVAFARFDSVNKRRAWQAEAVKRGLDVEGGQNMDSPGDRSRLDSRFANDVSEMAKDINPNFANEVWEHYLRSLPEVSWAKKGLPRAGRLGYTQDALRNFKGAVLRNASMVARLEHGHELDELVDRIKDEARAVERSPNTTNDDKLYASALAREFGKRADLIRNPKAAGWLASKVTKFGFGWYLYFAPATAFRIGVQNPTLAQPLLAKHFGEFGASKELLRAVGQWVGSKGTQGLIDTLRGGERTALEEARDMHLFSDTWANTLISGGPGGKINEGPLGTFFKAGSWLFNQLERKNRSTTMLAAYRLGITKGMSHEDAARLARNIVRDAHIDYSQAGRPRVLQSNDIARVMGQFKLYSGGVTYRLAREFRDMTRLDKGVTPEQRLQATHAFVSLLGRAALWSGVSGLPLYWLAEAVVNKVMGDKDRPYDMTAELNKHLADHYGQGVADGITRGPMSAITGVDLRSAANYNDLRYRAPSNARNMGWKDLGEDALTQLAGAGPGMALNAAEGADMIHQGNIERGIEHFAPTEVSSIMKAIRYYREGATNSRGEPIMTADEIGTKGAFFRAIGFTPERLSQQFDKNATFNSVRMAILDRKEQLLKQYADALEKGDDAALEKTLDEIDRFNGANRDDPGAYINNPTQSAVNRIRAEGTDVSGVRVTGFPGLANEIGVE